MPYCKLCRAYRLPKQRLKKRKNESKKLKKGLLSQSSETLMFVKWLRENMKKDIQEVRGKYEE